MYFQCNTPMAFNERAIQGNFGSIHNKNNKNMF